MSPPLQEFAQAFALTALGIAVTAALGRLARRRAHVVSAVVTVGIFVWTVYLAEILGQHLDIPRMHKWVHLSLANLATLALVGAGVTGGRLFRLEAEQRRRWHRRMVIAFLVLLVAATGTGTWMIGASSPRALPALD